MYIITSNSALTLVQVCQGSLTLHLCLHPGLSQKFQWYMIYLCQWEVLCQQVNPNLSGEAPSHSQKRRYFHRHNFLAWDGRTLLYVAAREIDQFINIDRITKQMAKSMCWSSRTYRYYSKTRPTHNAPKSSPKIIPNKAIASRQNY